MRYSLLLELQQVRGTARIGVPRHRRTERLNRELKRRTRVASLFPNEASALRLASAVLAETSEEWETGRIYLSMESS